MHYIFERPILTIERKHPVSRSARVLRVLGNRNIVKLDVSRVERGVSLPDGQESTRIHTGAFVVVHRARDEERKVADERASI